MSNGVVCPQVIVEHAKRKQLALNKALTNDERSRWLRSLIVRSGVGDHLCHEAVLRQYSGINSEENFCAGLCIAMWTIGEQGEITSCNPNESSQTECVNALINYIKYVFVVDFVVRLDRQRCFVWEMDYKGFARWGWYAIVDGMQAEVLDPSVGEIQTQRLDYRKSYWYRKEEVAHSV